MDPTRKVVRNGRVLAPKRILPTEVWMPRAVGRFPLVVFAHGYDIGPPAYARFCARLASAGYVVAAPSFPLEDPARGFGLSRTDLPNEATDVSFVIRAVHRGSLRARIRGATAVVGHSDGADVALMVGYRRGKTDRRVQAIVAMAPDPMTGSIVPAATPLLLVQGNADAVVPYSSSRAVFHQVRAPDYYLTLLGAGHIAPVHGGTKWTRTLDAAVAEFLDATIGGRGPGVRVLPAELRRLPLATLQIRQP